MDQADDLLASDRQQRLECAIATFLDHEAQGSSRDADELIAAYPDLATDLREFLANHQRIVQIVNSSHPNDRLAIEVPNVAITPRQNSSDFVEENSPKSSHRIFGDYELLHEIARGGMGVVYKARQLSLNRTVAIKMILQGTLAGSEEIERFKLEAKAVAQLTHPQIVVIYDVGHCDDQYFYAMEYVEGRSLAQVLRAGAISPRRAAEYVEQVAKAIHFAHQNGVVHRDIKPSNILIDEYERARVTDFGLAKHVDRGDELTLSGQMVGTPAYMAPEQITNRRGDIGPLCDVYSLGVLLYELLTKQLPFAGRDQFETLLQVLDCDPQSPRKVNSQVPRPLEMICLKCLEKDPQRRYASAADLADDLSRFLAGDPISLSSSKLVDRLMRTLERSQYDREIHTWARMLMHLAWISLATHVLVFFNHTIRPPHPLAGLIAIRLFEVVGMAAVLWGLREHWFPPRGAPARQLLSLWLGYMAGSLTLVIIAFLNSPPGTTFNDFRAYPPLAVLASLLFITLGSSYWGYCYTIGSLFLVLGILMTFWLAAAPLLFGVAWAASLSILSLRLHRLAGIP